LKDGEFSATACQGPLQSPAQLARCLRARLARQIYDDSGAAAAGSAIYSLSDPRDIRAIRYVGQTLSPRRRLAQHLATARLWLPEQTPWWVKSPRLRPLYRWIRELYADEGRLPVMVVHAWLDPADARRAEREQIRECLARQLPLLNVERERLAASDAEPPRGRRVSGERGRRCVAEVAARLK
jgi:hypothetical protein